ncbi:MAG: AtpZ/AtpI family protein [Leptolyngbya sp. SIO1E4]|nr:AtpZ/AtpI family protein [Leptolyngbya sp. SIO1E4]
MSKPSPENSSDHHSFLDNIGEKARRKLKARQTRKQVWFALGMFGMVGWAVTLPTLMGVALGVWIDRHVDSQYSWTLMLLAVGVGLGCWNAWYWVTKESQRD